MNHSDPVTKSQPTASIPMGVAMSPNVNPKTCGYATASLVCGIVGILVLGVILGPLAIIFGAIAINRIKEKPNELEGRGMAIAGIICGAVAIVVAILVIIYLVSLVKAAESQISNGNNYGYDYGYNYGYNN